MWDSLHNFCDCASLICMQSTGGDARPSRLFPAHSQTRLAIHQSRQQNPPPPHQPTQNPALSRRQMHTSFPLRSSGQHPRHVSQFLAGRATSAASASKSAKQREGCTISICELLIRVIPSQNVCLINFFCLRRTNLSAAKHGEPLLADGAGFQN